MSDFIGLEDYGRPKSGGSEGEEQITPKAHVAKDKAVVVSDSYGDQEILD